MSTPTPETAKIKQQFDAYLRAFNAHDTGLFGQYYTDNFSFHVPVFPPTSNKAETLALFEGGLTFFRETIHPTWLLFGERSVAMEAQMHSECLQDVDFPFPFTGRRYAKGEKFVYPIVAHYEYDDNYLITTFRSFSEVLNPDPGYGICKSILPGYEFVGDRKVN